MFWLMMYSILFGGSMVPELALVPEEKALIQTVTDEARLQEMMSIRDDMADREDALILFMKEQYSELIILSRDHADNYDNFKEMFERIDQARNTFQQSMIDQRFRLKEMMNREEWEAVMSKNAKGR